MSDTFDHALVVFARLGRATRDDELSIEERERLSEQQCRLLDAISIARRALESNVRRRLSLLRGFEEAEGARRGDVEEAYHQLGSLTYESVNLLKRLNFDR